MMKAPTTFRPFYKEPVSLLLHVLVAMVGGVFAGVLATILFGAICSAVGMRFQISVGFYNPLFWLPAVFFGFNARRISGYRAAPFAGAVGLTFLVAAMLWDISSLKHPPYYRNLTHSDYWSYEVEQLFSPSDRSCAHSECIGKIFITAPFIASIAYSTGAWLALWVRRNDHHADLAANIDQHPHA